MSLATTLDSIEKYFARVIGGTEKKIFKVEQEVIDFITPLAEEIQSTALTLGKQDLAAGLQILKDSVSTAVTAGAQALTNGQDPVKASETAFLATVAGEGKTALNNAEAGAIKAGVAIIQQAAAALNPTPVPQTAA